MSVFPARQSTGESLNFYTTILDIKKRIYQYTILLKYYTTTHYYYSPSSVSIFPARQSTGGDSRDDGRCAGGCD